MTTKIIAQEGLQYPSRVSGVIVFNNLKADGTAISAVGTHDLVLGTLPENAIITGGAVVTRTLWATAGTATIDVGDTDGTPDPDRYTTTPLNLETAGVLAIVPTNFRTAAQCNLTAQIVIGTAVATAGELSWWVDYFVFGRSHENMG